MKQLLISAIFILKNHGGYLSNWNTEYEIVTLNKDS